MTPSNASQASVRSNVRTPASSFSFSLPRSYSTPWSRITGEMSRSRALAASTRSALTRFSMNSSPPTTTTDLWSTGASSIETCSAAHRVRVSSSRAGDCTRWINLITDPISSRQLPQLQVPASNCCLIRSKSSNSAARIASCGGATSTSPSRTSTSTNSPRT